MPFQMKASDDLAEAADIIGLHPIPRIVGIRDLRYPMASASSDAGTYPFAGLTRMWMFFS